MPRIRPRYLGARIHISPERLHEFEIIEVEIMTVEAYTKKPVSITAAKWDGTVEEATPIINWILESGGNATYHCDNVADCLAHKENTAHKLRIQTLEGPIFASPGDYIIRGIQGEFYPCKPDIFDASYDKA